MRASVNHDLVEHLVADDVADRVGTRCPGVSMSTMNAVMPSCLAPRSIAVGVGAEQEEAPLGEVGGRDPDLLAVDDVLVAVADRGRAQVGEVGAGLRLAEALAPVLVGGEDPGQPLLLLLRRCPSAMIIGPICQMPLAL